MVINRLGSSPSIISRLIGWVLVLSSRSTLSHSPSLGEVELILPFKASEEPVINCIVSLTSYFSSAFIRVMTFFLVSVTR